MPVARRIKIYVFRDSSVRKVSVQVLDDRDVFQEATALFFWHDSAQNLGTVLRNGVSN
jgi:hypothetical protein